MKQRPMEVNNLMMSYQIGQDASLPATADTQRAVSTLSETVTC